MKKEYWLVLIVYITMQLSSPIGVPLVKDIINVKEDLAYSIWLVLKFVIALSIILLILRKDDLRFSKSKPLRMSYRWAVFGVVLALISQYAAVLIENLIGINFASKNTQHIAQVVSSFPLAVTVSSLFAPIIEEIVFRRILFGWLHKRLNFFIAAAASSFLFALSHMDPERIITYAAIGFVFAWLYVKRNNIIAPMFAHMVMNTIVLFINQ